MRIKDNDVKKRSSEMEIHGEVEQEPDSRFHFV